MMMGHVLALSLSASLLRATTASPLFKTPSVCERLGEDADCLGSEDEDEGEQGVTYAAAVSICEGIGGELATIRSEEENELARRACGDASCWLGLVEVGGDEDTPRGDQVWEWTDGSPVDFTNWEDGWESNWDGVDERHAMMNCCGPVDAEPSGVWYDAPGGWDGPIPLCRMQVPSAAPTVSPAPSLSPAPTPECPRELAGSGKCAECANDLCGSIGEDCCAPWDEEKVCYGGGRAVVSPRRCYGGDYGIYTCCVGRDAASVTSADLDAANHDWEWHPDEWSWDEDYDDEGWRRYWHVVAWSFLAGGVVLAIL